MEILCVIIAFALGLMLGERFAKKRENHAGQEEKLPVPEKKTAAEVQFENLFAYNGTGKGQQQIPREGGGE